MFGFRQRIKGQDGTWWGPAKGKPWQNIEREAHSGFGPGGRNGGVMLVTDARARDLFTLHLHLRIKMAVRLVQRWGAACCPRGTEGRGLKAKVSPASGAWPEMSRAAARCSKADLPSVQFLG
ncbi:unnamed protein product [Effrenium voratum]|nr:unnamed protein product [Effrenium voratum]